MTTKKMTTKIHETNKSENDIIRLILEDHKPLKQLIEIMKDSEKNVLERAAAFEEFAPLLLLHAKPEEESLYVYMKDHQELREDGYEGETEHSIADRLIEEIQAVEDDEDVWSAKVKVLAELVEHHIKEEEKEMFPEFLETSTVEERDHLGRRYQNLRRQFANEIQTAAMAKQKMQEESVVAH